MRLWEFCFPGVKLPVETTPVPCSIKQRWAGRCEHLTLPSSLMGTHCVLTFKVPRYLAPCLSGCFPPSCYLAVKAGDLTADLKDCSSTRVLFNDPPNPLLSLFLSQFCRTMFFHLSSSLFPRFSAAYFLSSRHCFNESERQSVRVAY